MNRLSLSILLVSFFMLTSTAMESPQKKSKKMRLLSCFHKNQKNTVTKSPPLPPSDITVKEETAPEKEKMPTVPASSSPRFTAAHEKHDPSKTTISSARKSSHAYKAVDFSALGEKTENPK